MKEGHLEMRLAILLSSIFLLSSCSRVKVYDDVWCADSGKFGAECFYTLSSGEFSLDKYQWDKLRVGQICTGSENRGEGYKHIRQAIEKLCADTNKCTLEEKKAIAEFASKAKRAMIRSMELDLAQ